MSAPEIIWRVRSRVQDTVDRWLAASRERPLPPDTVFDSAVDPRLASPMFLAPASALADEVDPKRYAGPGRAALLASANALMAHRIDLFDLKDIALGSRINWNYEYKASKPAPMTHVAGIDYRDYDLTGDCKFVWELNRHHQFVVLGRAYRATGDERYARAAVSMLADWIAQCPFGRGMNWRSPLELAIRLINWVWTLELIRPANVMGRGMWERIAESAYRHLDDISRKYSQFSSANNHLIGEAAGVYVGAAYFQGLRRAAKLRAEARRILHREIGEQTWGDGGNREQAMGYHLFVLQFFLTAGLMGRAVGDEFDGDYWAHVERMFEYIAVMIEAVEPGQSPPMFGDADDGYVLDLGGRHDAWRSWLGVGAALFGRRDFARIAGPHCEPALWLPGLDRPRTASSKDQAMGTSATADGSPALSSRALAETGYYLLQHGSTDGGPRISVVMDCGELGFRSIAAHGHADALSVVLRAFGREVLTDSGTYDYFTYGHWRDYFRGTAAHNTLVVDNRNQSEILGSFLWGRRANAICTEWSPAEDGGRLVAEHDGYTDLPDPVTHRRAVTLEGSAGRVVVEDEVVARESHELAFHWHLAEHSRAKRTGAHEYTIDCEGRGTIVMRFDPALALVEVSGREEPPLGWVSRSYHHKTPTTTLVASVRSTGAARFRTEFCIVDGGSRAG